MNQELTKRRKLLFPEIFMTATEREQFAAKMAAQVVDSNNLGGSDNALWSIVSPEAIDAVSKEYFDLSLTSHVVESNIPADKKIRPVVYVEVVKGAGAALKNATDWKKSALESDYVPVTLDRYSRPFGLSSYDIMHGERIETKLRAAIEAVVSAVVNDFYATALNSGAANFTVDAATFAPEVVAQQISALFGGSGSVKDLVLDPTMFAKLVPTNALGLGTEPGTYGIDRIHRSAGLNMATAPTSTAGLHGLALRNGGIVAGFGVPDFGGMNGIAVRSLGTVAGIPLVLKSWVENGEEAIFNSVETMAGFAVGDKNAVYMLKTA